MAFPLGWTRKQKITINYTPGETLTGFPVLITQAHLAADVFAKAHASGRDLRFSVDKEGTVYCPREIEVFGASNTKIHVQVPTLTTGTNELWVWYGNASTVSAFEPFKYFDDLRWHFSSSDFESYWQPVNDTIEVSVPSSVATDKWMGLFPDAPVLAGDGTIEVGYDFTGSQQPASSNHILYPILLSSTDSYLAVIARYESDGLVHFRVLGTGTTVATFTTASLSGKVKVTRSGSTYTVWYWSGTQWEWDGNTAGLTPATILGAEDVYQQFVVKSLANTTFKATFLNFSSPTGAMAPPLITPSPWDDDFIAIYHLNEDGNGTAGEYKDSSKNNLHAAGINNGTITPPTRVTTSWYYGQDFDAVAKDGVQTPQSSLLRPRYTFTCEMLMRSDGLAWGTPQGLGKAGSGPNCFFQADGTTFTLRPSDGAITGKINFVGAGHANGVFEAIAQVYDLTQADNIDRAQLFVNGARETNGSLLIAHPDQFHNGTPPVDTSYTFGCNLASGTSFDGVLDEIRLSSVARSAGWLAATHATLMSSSAFASVGNATWAYGQEFHQVATPNHADALGYPFQSNAFFDGLYYQCHYTDGAYFTLANGIGDKSETPATISFSNKKQTATTQKNTTLSVTTFAVDFFQRTYMVCDSGLTITKLHAYSPRYDTTMNLALGDNAYGLHPSVCEGVWMRDGANPHTIIAYVAANNWLSLRGSGGWYTENPGTAMPLSKAVADLGTTDRYPQAYCCSGNVGVCLVIPDGGGNHVFWDYKNAANVAFSAGLTPVQLNTNGWYCKDQLNFKMVAAYQSPFRFLFFRDAASPDILRYCVYDAANFITSGTVTTSLISGDFGFTATQDIGAYMLHERCYCYYVRADGHLCRRTLSITNSPDVNRSYFVNNWWTVGFQISEEEVLTEAPVALKVNNIQSPQVSFRQTGVVFQDTAGNLMLYRDIIPVAYPTIDSAPTRRVLPDSEGMGTQTAYNRPLVFGDKALVPWASDATLYANIWDYSLGQWLYSTRMRISHRYDDGHNVPLVDLDAEGYIWILEGGRNGMSVEILRVYRSHKKITDADISDLLNFSLWTYIGSPANQSRGYKNFFVDANKNPHAMFFESTTLTNFGIRGYRSQLGSWSTYADALFVGTGGGSDGYATMPMASKGLEDISVGASYHIAFPWANYTPGSTTFRVTQLNYMKVVATVDGKYRGFGADGREMVLPVHRTISRSGGLPDEFDLYCDGDVTASCYAATQAGTLKNWTAEEAGIKLGDNRVSNGYVWSCQNIGTCIDPFNGTTVDTAVWDQVNPSGQSVLDNEVILDLPTTDSLTSSITTKAEVAGDFDIIVTFNLQTYSIPYTGAPQLAGLEVSDGTNYVQVHRVVSGADHTYQIIRDGASWLYDLISQGYAHPALKARLRIKRVGSVLTVFVWSFSRAYGCWEWNGNTLGQADYARQWSGPVKIRLYATQAAAPFRVNFSDLYLQSASTYTCGQSNPFPLTPTHRQQVTDGEVIWQYVCKDFAQPFNQGGDATPITFRNQSEVFIGGIVAADGFNLSGAARIFWDGSLWTTEIREFLNERPYYTNSMVNLSNMVMAAVPGAGTMVPSIAKSIDYCDHFTTSEPIFDPAEADYRASPFTASMSFLNGGSGIVAWTAASGAVFMGWMAEVPIEWGALQVRTVFGDQFQGYFMGV